MTDEATAPRRQTYLPVPPDGWEYEVVLKRSDVIDGGSIRLTMEHDERNEVTSSAIVRVSSSAGTKNLVRASLREGIRAAVDAAKVLDRLARTEAEYREARDAALASLGGDTDDEEPVSDEEPQTSPPLAEDAYGDVENGDGATTYVNSPTTGGPVADGADK